jgi:hypothetical protein
MNNLDYDLERQRERMQPEPVGSAIDSVDDETLVNLYLESMKDDRAVMSDLVSEIFYDPDAARTFVYKALDNLSIDDDEWLMNHARRIIVNFCRDMAVAWAKEREANGEWEQ